MAFLRQVLILDLDQERIPIDSGDKRKMIHCLLLSTLFPSCPIAPVLVVPLEQGPLTQWQAAPSRMRGTAAHAACLPLAGVVLTNANRNSRDRHGEGWKVLKGKTPGGMQKD